MWEARISTERNEEDKALARLPLTVGEEVEAEENSHLKQAEQGVLGKTKSQIIEMPTPND